MKRRRIDVFDLAVMAALVATFLAIARMPFAPPKFEDQYFHQEGRSLALFFQGAGPWKDVVITRAPAPDIYYAIPYLLVPPGSGRNIYWLAAIFWNALWVIVATLLIRRTGEALAGPLAGKVAAILSLIAPFVVYYSCGVGAETPAYLGLVIFVYGWAKAQATGLDFWRYKTTALAGLVLFVLSRPNAALLIGLLGPVALGLWLKGAAVARREAKFAFLCAFVAVASLLATSKMLALLPKKLGTSQQAKNFSDVMFFGSFQCRTELFDWRFWGKKTKAGSVDYQDWSTEHDRLVEDSKTGLALPSLELNWAVQDILHHPFLRLRMTAVRVLMLNVAIMNSERVEQFGSLSLAGRLFFIIAHVFVNAIGSLPLVGAIFFLVRFRSQLLSFWPLWTPWLTLLLFHAFVYAEPRYMLSSRPLLSLMAAIWISAWMKHKQTGAGANHSLIDEQPPLAFEGMPAKEVQIFSVTRTRAAQI